MARLSDLMKCVAQACGVPEASARVMARALRESGLVSKGGRGLNAAQMSTADVANILIAFATPCDATKLGSAVANAGGLVLTGAAPVRLEHRPLNSELKKSIDPVKLRIGDHLHDSIVRLLESYKDKGSTSNNVEDYIDTSPRFDVGMSSTFGKVNYIEDMTPCGVSIKISSQIDINRCELDIECIGGDIYKYVFNNKLKSYDRKNNEYRVVGRVESIKIDSYIFDLAMKCMNS